MLKTMLPSIAVIVCYALAVNLRIELQVGAVDLGAAFAPALMAVARGTGPRDLVVIIAGLLAGAAVGLLRGRSLRGMLADVPTVATASLVFLGVEVLISEFGVRLAHRLDAVVAGSVAVLAYSLVSDRARHLRSRVHREDRIVWLLLQTVLVSAFGLMILGYDQLGWPSIVIVCIVLAVTKTEFDRYALARRTLVQTVAALSLLQEASLP
jgi:hypothetical protein